MIETRKNFRVREALIDSDKVVFVFTAMGTQMGQYGWFLKLLNKKGYSAIIYDYTARLVLNAEFESYDKLYEDIQADAYERIEKLQPKYIYAYGVSMGTIIANKLTRDTPAIQHVAMSLTYGDVATNILHSPATKKTVHSMKSKNLTEDDLRAAVRFMDPIQNAKGLQGKKVWLHLSRRDRVLDYKITVKTKEAFEQNIKEFKYTESKYLGHYITGVKHMLNVGELDKFYRT